MQRRQLLMASAATLSAAALSPFATTQLQAETVTPYGLPIASEFPFVKKSVTINGSDMAYVDEGYGPVVLILHGNPTSSYLWRNIIPLVAASGHRAIAPDLIGMGDSGKPNISYTFDQHAAYLDGLIASLELTNITLVVHDCGSGLGMRYARLNPGNVRALSFMEAIIPPAFLVASYEDMGEIGGLFKALRTQGVGEDMVLKNNFFVEGILQNMGVARGVADAEMAHYRARYPTEQSRRPTLQ